MLPLQTFHVLQLKLIDEKVNSNVGRYRMMQMLRGEVLKRDLENNNSASGTGFLTYPGRQGHNQ